MKIATSSVLALLLLAGCGSGGVPGGDQTINISTSQDQNQENTQTQSDGDLNCNTTCTISENGAVSGSKDCGGPSGITAIAVATLDQCDSIKDLRPTVASSETVVE